VATDSQSGAALAAYYPGWRTGGVLAFHEHRLRVRLRHLRRQGEIRDDHGVVARLRWMGDEVVPSVMHLEIGPVARDAPDLDLAVLLGVWIIMLETSIVWPLGAAR
jgi:hypothetical protein